MSSDTVTAPSTDYIFRLPVSYRPPDTALLLRPEIVHMVDRPSEDATSAEIAKWMEESFGEAIADGIEQAVETDEEHDSDD